MGSVELNQEPVHGFDDHESQFLNPLDPEEFRKQGHKIIDFLADYYQNIESYPILSQVQPGYLQQHLSESAPNAPEPIETIILDIQKHIIPGITHWQSPNYFAYFPSSGSTTGFLGEMLSFGFNIVGFNWMSSPAATELESIVMDWLGKMLMLPKSFLFSGNGGGVIQGTTCEAILCTLVAARDQYLSQNGIENRGKLVVYGSDQTHSALQKAAKIACIDPNIVRAIKTTKTTSFSLSPELLKHTIESDLTTGLVPLFLCATVGTTSTTAIDPVGPLCQVAKNYGIWVHIDAAYADCCCLWVKDPTALTKSLSTYPEYLRNKVSDTKKIVDYKDWQITLSRRFRAMKLWLVLRSYGIANLRNIIRSHVKMAILFEQFVADDSRLEIVVPRNFAVVCFRVSSFALSDKLVNYENNCVGDRTNELTRELLESINASGKLFMTHALVDGIYMIRFAVGATLTRFHHIVMAWNVVQDFLNKILAT